MPAEIASAGMALNEAGLLEARDRLMGWNRPVTLQKAGIADAEEIWRMQKKAFWPLYEKYHDDETSPATETPDRVRKRIAQPETDYYFILLDREKAGAIRALRLPEGHMRVSPVFVLPEYQGRGVGNDSGGKRERAPVRKRGLSPDWRGKTNQRTHDAYWV
jgi:GNAT superfamily N-acetyltransferase